VFVIRLEDGEVLHETLEEFARRHGVQRGSLLVIGGADAGSRLVVGPEGTGRENPVRPMEHLLGGVHEIAGVGTLFPDASGNPVLHMHIAGGRQDNAVAGCVRRGVRVWQVMEVILYELTGSSSRRLREDSTGFELLSP
jgi:predicted DNA-binding protein with PD1-like motif